MLANRLAVGSCLRTLCHQCVWRISNKRDAEEDNLEKIDTKHKVFQWRANRGRTPTYARCCFLYHKTVKASPASSDIFLLLTLGT